MKVTPENIRALKPNQVFVFGSNLAGHHAAGAALHAFINYGAIGGQGEGIMGNCYALPTKDAQIQTLPLETIQFYVDQLHSVVTRFLETEFLITAVGTGLAGLTVEQMAPMFRDFMGLPNVSLPKDFIEYLKATTIVNET